MAKKIKIGDIFAVPLKDGMTGYVQYIGVDSTQLYSQVVRVFRKHYESETIPDINLLVAGEVDFYAHVTDIKFGVEDGTWKQVDWSESVDDNKKPLFRASNDYGHPKVKISKSWYIWRMGEAMRDVGELLGPNRLADIGSVTWPERIKIKMETGEYPVFYPAYE